MTIQILTSHNTLPGKTEHAK